MSDKPKHKNPKLPQHRLEKKAVPLTPEEQAKVLAEMQKAQAEAKAERERIELYSKSVPKLSHRQLRGELRRAIRREYAGKPPEPQAGLNICLATILLTVLNNTETGETRLRKDQINPFGKLAAYPRSGKVWQDRVNV